MGDGREIARINYQSPLSMCLTWRGEDREEEDENLR